MFWKKFTALGTECVISADIKDNQTKIIEASEKEVFDFEKKFSRFLVGNELYKFNNLVQGDFKASDIMIEMIKEAKLLFKLTRGTFDPTVIGSLEAIGYDQSFGNILPDDSTIDTVRIKKDFLKRPDFAKLKITGKVIKKPENLRIDLGGIGKGFIVDFLSDNYFSKTKNYWISMGGDLLVKGNDENKTGWKIGVQDPSEPDREVFSIKTKGEKLGIATSGIFKRKGKKGNLEWHHLIDPRSGMPVENNVLAVTAIAKNATRADVFAKTVLILGEKSGMDFIESQPDAAAIIFFKSGGASFSKRATGYF